MGSINNPFRPLIQWWRNETPADGSSEPSSSASSFMEIEADLESTTPITREQLIYRPSPRDILHVSAILSSTPLPNERIDPILELAEYWAHMKTRIESTPESPLTKAVGRSREHVHLFNTAPICSLAAGDKGEWDSAPESGIRITDRDDLPSTTNSGSRARYYTTLPAHLIPEPRNLHPVRRITWRIRSHDQGWSGERGDTYDNSWTGFWGSVSRYMPPALPAWGNASVEQDKGQATKVYSSKEYVRAWSAPFDKPTHEPSPDGDRGVYVEGDVDEDRVWPRKSWCFDGTRIQANARAQRDSREHIVVWDYRDDIDTTHPNAQELLAKKGRGTDTGAGVQVRALQRGDVVGLHSYAYFPGWSNTVEHAEVTIEFAL